MSSSGLTRRRGGGGAGGANADGETNNGGTPGRTNSSSNFKDSAPETSYESSENGHKIAFDPRDISESAERNKQPKLTLMEEVLLLGLKDKQVRASSLSRFKIKNMTEKVVLTSRPRTRRAIYLSGTIISRMPSVDALS
jgi:hypothetical protein